LILPMFMQQHWSTECVVVFFFSVHPLYSLSLLPPHTPFTTGHQSYETTRNSIQKENPHAKQPRSHLGQQW
jgi:hypothetical protein